MPDESEEEETAAQSRKRRTAENASTLETFQADANERRREWKAASAELENEDEAKRRRPWWSRGQSSSERMRRQREVERLRLQWEFAARRVALKRRELEVAEQDGRQEMRFSAPVLWAYPETDEPLMPAAELEKLWTETIERLRRTHAESLQLLSDSKVAVSIYLADENIHDQVEAVVEQWLTAAHLTIESRDDPVIGSWFRRLTAGAKSAAGSPAAREALLTATHVADSHLIQAQDAYVTSSLLQNVGPVLQALQPTRDAVVRAGALLIVKIDWVVQVHQLTAVQQAILDHQPKLLASPAEIAATLQLQDSVAQEAAIPSTPQHEGGGEAAGAAAN